MMKTGPMKFQTKGEKVQTPKGIGQYLWIDQPNTKFAEGGAGDYTVTILLQQHEAKPIMDAIDRIREAAAAEVRASGKKPKLADDPYQVDETTGLIKLRFKKAAESNFDGKKVKNHVAVADARGNLIPVGQVPRVGSGSIIKVNGYLSPWYVPALGVGVSLKLRGVQIVKMNSFSGEDAKFEAEEIEDGFEFVPGSSGSSNGVDSGSGSGGIADVPFDGSSDVDF
jgi:hypothetical protein